MSQPNEQLPVEGQEPEKGPSKSALKKAAAKQKKEQAKAERAKGRETTATEQQGPDVSEGKYGVLPLIQSTERKGRTFTRVEELDASKANQKVLIRGRLHASRGKGNLCFLVIRQRLYTVQVVLAKGAEVSKQMLKFAGEVTRESIVDIEGTVTVPKDKIESTTQKDVEISAHTLFVVTAAATPLPLQIEDAARPKSVLSAQSKEVKAIEAQINEVTDKLNALTDKESAEAKQLTETLNKLVQQKSEAQKYVKVKRETRLDNRVLDLRTPANQAIFLLQSAVGQLFREYLYSQGFVEIHSPKLIGTASEGGANVFKLGYFDKFAFLAQSPQLYKQMGICADMERVFEIGPVFRAENSNTHRHLCEFVGLDLEMAFNEHYHEVLDLLGELFVHIFEGLEKRFAKQLEIVGQQFPFEPLKFAKPTLRLEFKEGVKMLKDAGIEMGEYDDLSTANERFLGKLVREKYNTDFYILDKFPKAVRPFYTMPDPNHPEYSNSYDFFIRGEEIMSGAQRIHDPNFLQQRAQECGVGIEGIKDYVNSFNYGILPHAGGGIGLERVVMLYLGLKNIRQTSMFPRDPKRLTP